VSALEERLARLAEAGIQLLPLPDIGQYFVLERDGFIALVERTADGGFGRIGPAGLLTEQGFAALVWKGERAFFIAKAFEEEAGSERLLLLRRFSDDLARALS
jgi:hypothetical protein